MKGNKYRSNKNHRGRGWFGESHRHYLAAKGIKTGSKHNYRYFQNEDDFDFPTLPKKRIQQPPEERLVNMFIENLPSDKKIRAFELKDEIQNIRDEIDKVRSDLRGPEGISNSQLRERRSELMSFIFNQRPDLKETWNRLIKENKRKPAGSRKTNRELFEMMDIDDPDLQDEVEEINEIHEEIQRRRDSPRSEYLRELQKRRSDLLNEFSQLTGRGPRGERAPEAMTRDQMVGTLVRSGEFSSREAADNFLEEEEGRIFLDEVNRLVDAGLPEEEATRIVSERGSLSRSVQGFRDIKKDLGITGRLRPLERLVIDRRPDLVPRLEKEQSRAQAAERKRQELAQERKEKNLKRGKKEIQDAVSRGDITPSQAEELEENLEELAGRGELSTIPRFGERKGGFTSMGEREKKLTQDQESVREFFIRGQVNEIKDKVRGRRIAEVPGEVFEPLSETSGKGVEQIRETFRREGVENVEPEEFFARKYMADKRTDDLSAGERIFGAGIITNARAVEKVQRSKLFGGFSQDPETGESDGGA